MKICRSTLDKLALCKKKYITVTVLHLWIKLSVRRLWKDQIWETNTEGKNTSEEDWQSYAKQRDLCLRILVKKDKRSYLTLNEENVKDSRKFWKTGTQMFSNILVNSEKITLVNNDKIITDDKETAKVFLKRN